MSKHACVVGAVLMTLAAGASANPQAAEPAIATSFADASLQWGACPAFIPTGCEIAVLHGDPAKDNADIFFKLPAGFTVPDHWHTSAERMVLVSGEMTVTYKGQAPVTLKPGMYAYGPAKLAHTAVCSAAAPCILFIAFESAVDAIPTEHADKIAE